MAVVPNSIGLPPKDSNPIDLRTKTAITAIYSIKPYQRFPILMTFISF